MSDWSAWQAASLFVLCAVYKLYLIHQFSPDLDSADLAMLIWLKIFCKPMAGLPQCTLLRLLSKTTQKLQLVQNAASQLLSGAGCRQHMLPILKLLHWLPGCSHVQFMILVMTFKAFHDLGPTYVMHCLLLYVPVCQLYFSGSFLLTIPPLQMPHLASNRAWAIWIIAMALWDGLSEEVRAAVLGNLQEAPQGFWRRIC